MQKLFAVILTVVLLLSLVGCVREQQPDETTAAPTPAVTTTAETSITETTVPVETDAPQITAAPSVVETVDALPAAAETAILQAACVGGNPTFYVFEDGLTYYVQVLGDPAAREVTALSKCVLSLPEGYTDGKIVDAMGGAGSGEVIFTVSAQKGEASMLLDYLFYSDNLADPVYIWTDETTPVRP